jgi:outer membrane receptor protein involved in Fe transport
MFDRPFAVAGLLCATAISSGLCATAAQAQSVQEAEYALPAQELARSLRDVAVRSGIGVIAPSELVAGKQAPPLRGRYGAREAVELLLQGSGLRAELVGDALVISRATAPSEADRALAAEDEEARTIVVTGTHLRGAPVTSPIITIGRREIDEAAPASVEELMRRLPQNVASGVGQENHAVTGAGADVTEHGAGINLRGLGQRATLVLINGRRVAPSGTGSFIDVSLIPITAIERVDILTDGASAIYGSDAVGGVVNFILREDVRGLEPVLQAGTSTRGGGDQIVAGLSAGAQWKGGHGLLSYEYRDEGRITAGERDFTINLPSQWSLFPKEQRHSVYGTARQQRTGALDLELSGQYAARDTDRSFFIAGPAVPVNVAARSRSYGGTAALQLDLGSSWRAEATASYHRARGREVSVQPEGQGLFNRFESLSSVREFGLKADGSVIDLPAGPVKLAVGGALRRERFESVFETLVNLPNPQAGSRDVGSLYGELSLPLFSSRNRRPGLEALTLTAAGRLDRYEGLGTTFNPKIGALWSPAAGLSLRTTYSTSFRAPLLYEQLGIYNVFLFPAAILFVDPSQAPDGVGAALIGSNPEVQPERSKSFSVGADFTPNSVPGLRLSATYYAIRFSNRIALPTDQIVVVGDPALEPIVTRDPSGAQVSGIFAGAGQVLDFSGPGFTSGGAGPEDVVVLVDARVANTAETRTSGLDLGFDYAFALGGNRFRLELNANKVFKFDDQLTSASPAIHTLNTPFHAIDWRARGGASWARGPFSAVVFVNYTDGYRDRRGGRSQPVRSFTTVDAGLAYTGSASAGPLSKLRLALNVNNLFDADPPKLLPEPGFMRGVGYDPVNASGRGRTLPFQIRRSW